MNKPPLLKKWRCEVDYREVKEITPKQAREMLRKKGIEISLEETEEVLEFLRMLARMAVKHHLKTATAKGSDGLSTTETA